MDKIKAKKYLESLGQYCIIHIFLIFMLKYKQKMQVYDHSLQIKIKSNH
jgi:hypothetical protein